MSVDSLPKRIKVLAYSGYKANERPLYFFLDDRKFEVQDIVDRWYGIEHDYYKVLAGDAKVYLLRWDRKRDVWFLERVTQRSAS